MYFKAHSGSFVEEGLEEWKQDGRMSEEAWALAEEKEDGSLG